MSFLIWTILLFSVRGHKVDTGASSKGGCEDGFCLNLQEMTAEAGLCGAILCSFTTSKDFAPQHIVWYKCEPSKERCADTDIIFHTDKENNKIQSEFRGRVSPLEPDNQGKNCSIIINDLTESDSGSYQLRVTGIKNGTKDEFIFTPRATVSVKDLTQKPSVMIPPLTEGQQTTLTCTAPGLCSGSDPEITWSWRGAGEKDSHITGNITAFKTENLTAVTKRHSSTLTFNPSTTQHHGTEVNCKVSFTNNITTEETVTLNVTYVKELVITGNTTVKKGDALNLTCSVDSFPASHITWTKYGSNKSLHENNENELQKPDGPASLILHNMTAEHSGQYICTATHLNNTLVKKVNVRLDGNKLFISEYATVKEGDALNLTCSVERFGPYVITWTKLSSNKNLQKEIGVILQNGTGTSTLIILNVSAEYSGQYICTAEHQFTTHAVVTVSFFPKILSSSGCQVQSEVLTCVCIGEGFPSPTIKWPLLKNHAKYFVGTTVSDHTANSTVTVSVKDRNYTSVECVSSSDIGEAKENLKIIKTEFKQKDRLKAFLINFKELQVIIAFLIGILLSSTICCLARICSRKKQKSSEKLTENLEMSTTQVVPLIDPCQAVENGTHDQEAAEGGADAAGQSAPGGDVEYSDIDFSLLKQKSPTGAEDTQDTIETEYAEIKNKETEERQDNGGDGSEMVEGIEEVEVIVGEDETKQGVYPEEEGVADVAVYSNVNEIMNEIAKLEPLNNSVLVVEAKQYTPDDLT